MIGNASSPRKARNTSKISPRRYGKSRRSSDFSDHPLNGSPCLCHFPHVPTHTAQSLSPARREFQPQRPVDARSPHLVRRPVIQSRKGAEHQGAQPVTAPPCELSNPTTCEQDYAAFGASCSPTGSRSVPTDPHFRSVLNLTKIGFSFRSVSSSETSSASWK